MPSKTHNPLKQAIAHLDSRKPNKTSTGIDTLSNDELVKARNSVLQTESERNIYAVSQARKSETCFRNMDVNDIAKIINRTSYFLGLREPLEKSTLRLQAEFLQSNYPTVTVSVFKNAFELAAAQKLNVETEFFGNWTPQYMGRILNAYKEKMGAIEIRVRQHEERLRAENEVRLKSEMFDIEVSLSKMIYSAYQEWEIIESQKNPDYSWVYVWQLRHIGECLEKYTVLKPDTILRSKWKKNDEESTIELFGRFFTSIKEYEGLEFTEKGFAKWLSEFYIKKQ